MKRLLSTAMRFTAFAIAASLFTAARVNAQSIGLSLTSPGSTYDGTPYTLGWEFSVNQAINVTGLGVYVNDTIDGLGSSAQVGLWDASGDLLSSATVPAGLGGTLVNDFLFTDVTPVPLSIGTDYIVAAYEADLASSINVAQGGLGSYNAVVNGIEDRFILSSSLTFPTSTVGLSGGAWLGGNFEFTPAPPATPETSPIVSLSLGCMIFGASSVLRRRRTQIVT